MNRKAISAAAWPCLLGLAGCASDPAVDRYAPPPVAAYPTRAVAAAPPASAGVVPAGHAAPPARGGSPRDEAQPGVGAGGAVAVLARPELTLPSLIAQTVERNPRLAQVAWAVDTARGRAVQAGLYPNPTVNITGNELGDRTGPGGIWTTPYVSQEVVTADKLGLSRAAALKEVDQATLAVIAERYRVFTDVRQNFFEVVTLQTRAKILGELIGLAERSVDNANKLLKAKEVSQLDVVQLEVDLERYRAEADATSRSLPAAFRRLAASVGAPDLPYAPVVGDLDWALPDYDLDRLRPYVVGIHPDVRHAQVGVERAQLLLKRAAVEPIPNLTIGAGYTRQNQNKSSDWDVGVSLPVPLWNRNQGNISAAKAQVGEAIALVGRAENDLVGRLASAFATYAAARQRADRYRATILPKSEESYRLSARAYQGGQFEYLRVLQAQRAVAEARLEYVRSLGEVWRAAGEIAGLMLEDHWPALPPLEVGPDATPEPEPVPKPKAEPEPAPKL